MSQMEQRKIAVLLTVEEAKEFLKSTQKTSRVLALNPNVEAELLGVYQGRIITTREVFTDLDHMRILCISRRMRRELSRLLDGEYRLSDATKEALIGILPLVIAAVLRVQRSLHRAGEKYVVWDGNSFTSVAIDKAQDILFQKIVLSFPLLQLTGEFNLLAPLLRVCNRVAVNQLRKTKPLLFTAPIYGLPNLATHLTSEPYHRNIVYIVETRSALKGIYLAIKAISNLRKGEKTHRLGFLPQYNRKTASEIDKLLSGFQDRTIKECIGRYRGIIDKFCSLTESLRKEASILIPTLKPTCLVAHSLRWISEAALGSVCLEHKIPSYLLSHGSHPAPQGAASIAAMQELSQGLLYSPLASINCLQSPHAEQAFQAASQTWGQTMKTVPIMWGFKNAENRPKESKKFIMLHAGGFKNLQGTRPWIYETSDEYVHGLKELIQVTQGIPDLELIIRTRSEPEVSIEALHKLLPASNHYRIKSDGSFLDDLMSADMLVSFSSTTTEEALQLGRPVILWGGTQRYQHLQGISDPDFAIRSAVYTPRSCEDFKRMLPKIIAAHQSSPLTREELAPHQWREKVMTIPDFVHHLADLC